MGETPFAENVDATRRTRLASERTYLVWWRTGLTSFAVSFGAGRLVPELSSGAAWPFQAIGVAFALAGVAFVGYGYRRYVWVERALARGEYAGADAWAILLFAMPVGAGSVFPATVVLVVAHPD